MSHPPPELLGTASDGTPFLIGHRCQHCSRVAFPPDPYGCESCGALLDQLEPTELRASGVVQAVATVHRHHREVPPTPFTVAAIVLDDGPLLKAVLADESADAQVGDCVRGVAEPADSPLPLRFARVDDQTGTN